MFCSSRRRYILNINEVIFKFVLCEKIYLKGNVNMRILGPCLFIIFKIETVPNCGECYIPISFYFYQINYKIR